jgi:hypothetical protein
MTKVQISTSYDHHPVLGPVLTGRVLTGPDKGMTKSVAFDYTARDVYIGGVTALVAKLGMTGRATYAGTTNTGGNVYDVEI